MFGGVYVLCIYTICSLPSTNWKLCTLCAVYRFAIVWMCGSTDSASYRQRYGLKPAGTRSCRGIAWARYQRECLELPYAIVVARQALLRVWRQFEYLHINLWFRNEMNTEHNVACLLIDIHKAKCHLCSFPYYFRLGNARLTWRHAHAGVPRLSYVTTYATHWYLCM